MPKRSMYIWKLGQVIDAEGGVDQVVGKAGRAKLSALWIKIADGASPYRNVTGETLKAFRSLTERCHDKKIEVWGWHVPHCIDGDAAREEAKIVRHLASSLKIDGLIMDAEGGPEFFQGGKDEAELYSSEMRSVASDLEIPLAISSNDIPSNISGWLPRFNKIAAAATINYPQTYYGGSPSVQNRLDRAENGNSHVTVPFAPVGAAWIGGGGGCASASACAERAREFIRIAKKRGYPEYSFWHWGGAPSSFWAVLNTTDA